MESWAVFEISWARCLHLNHLPEAARTTPFYAHPISGSSPLRLNGTTTARRSTTDGALPAGEEDSRRNQPNTRAVVGKSGSDSAVGQGPCIADLSRPHLFARALDDAVLPDMSSSTTTSGGQADVERELIGVLASQLHSSTRSKEQHLVCRTKAVVYTKG